MTSESPVSVANFHESLLFFLEYNNIKLINFVCSIATDNWEIIMTVSLNTKEQTYVFNSTCSLHHVYLKIFALFQFQRLKFVGEDNCFIKLTELPTAEE